MRFLNFIMLAGFIALASCDGPIKIEMTENIIKDEEKKEVPWISLGKIIVDEYPYSFESITERTADLYALIIGEHCFYKIELFSDSYVVIKGNFKREPHYKKVYNAKAGEYYFNFNIEKY